MGRLSAAHQHVGGVDRTAELYSRLLTAGKVSHVTAVENQIALLTRLRGAGRTIFINP
jgi:hypothetical protein